MQQEINARAKIFGGHAQILPFVIAYSEQQGRSNTYMYLYFLDTVVIFIFIFFSHHLVLLYHVLVTCTFQYGQYW